MSLNLIFREKLTKVENFLNDPTKVPSPEDIYELIKTELFTIVEEQENNYSKLIKDMQNFKVKNGNYTQVVEYYKEMDDEFKDNIKYALKVFIKISKSVNDTGVLNEQKDWLEVLNDL